MPASPGSEPREHSAGALADKVADWQARRFEVLRRQREATTPMDDALPDDLLADREATRRAIDDARRG